MDLTNLHWLGAAEAARLIRDGVISSVQLVEACLARVRDVDGQIQAWAFLDPEHALAQARSADEHRLSGQPTGPLHGVPVGIKDIIDTADMPTENGSVLHAGRTAWSRGTACSNSRARSITSACSRARSRTSRCCWSSSRLTTSGTRTRGRAPASRIVPWSPRSPHWSPCSPS